MNSLLFGTEMPDWLAGLPWNLILIPITTAIIGYYTNWLGIKMLFDQNGVLTVTIPKASNNEGGQSLDIN